MEPGWTLRICKRQELDRRLNPPLVLKEQVRERAELLALISPSAWPATQSHYKTSTRGAGSSG